jgi:hypothetical protein
LDKILQVPAKHIQSTQIEGENVQNFKVLKINVDKYVSHSDLYAIYVDDVDIILAYP